MMTDRARPGLLGALFAFHVLACGGAAPEVRTDVVSLDGAAARAGATSARPVIDDGRAPRMAAAPVTPRNAAPIAFRPWSVAVEEEARRKRTPLLVYVRAEWCAPCAMIERDTFADVDVRLAASAYVPVMIDVTEESASTNALVERFEITKMPCMKIVHVDGTADAPRLRQDECLPDVIAPDALASALQEAAR